MPEHKFPTPPKGYQAGEPTIRVEQTFYPKPPKVKAEMPKVHKPQPMDVRIVSIRDAVRRRLAKKR